MVCTVAHIRDRYLPLTEPFIYEYLTKMERYRPILLTNEILNLDLFPFSDLYLAPWLDRYSWRWLWYTCRKKLFSREVYYSYHNSYYENIINKNNVKLIHAHFGPEGVKALGLKKRLNLPLITTFYGFDVSKYARQKRWRTAYKTLFNDGELFLAEGNFMKKSLIDLGCLPEKIRILHIGVNTKNIRYKERHLNSGDEKIRILFCGRLVEKKGLVYGLKAIKMLTNKFPQLELRILGDGELKNEIVNFISKENLQNNTVMLGYQPHHVFFEEIMHAHIALQPSVTAQDGDSEGGAPTVLLEAQASGMPVVSTLHADIPEVVINEKSGFLVPERNAEALAEKLELLIDSTGQWAEMGKQGRTHIENNYNIYSEVRKLEDIYQETIHSYSGNQST